MRRLLTALRSRRRTLAVLVPLSLSAALTTVVGAIRLDGVLVVIGMFGLGGTAIWLVPHVVAMARRWRSGRTPRERRPAPLADRVERLLAMPTLTPQQLDSLRSDAFALHERGHMGLSIAAQKRLSTETGRPSDERRLARFEGQRRFLLGEDAPQLLAEPLPELVAMRVLHIVKSDLSTAQAGYTIRTHRTARAQVEAGFEVHVVAQRRSSEIDPGQSTRDGVVYHQLPSAAATELAADEWFADHVRALSVLVSELRPAVLHAASDFVNARAALIVGRALGIPVVYEVRGFWEETLRSSLEHRFGRPRWRDRVLRRVPEPESYTVRRQAEEDVWRQVDALVTLSSRMARRIRRAGVPTSRITVVPNAIDPTSVYPVPRDPEKVRALGLREHAAIIGYVTSLNEYEGIDVLIDAFARVRARARRDAVGLVIVGDGPERAALEEHAKRVGNRGIVFAGRVDPDDVAQYYAMLDLFVIPRRPVEVCHLVAPLKPYEALAFGRPLLVSDVGALRDLARESGGARLATAGSARSFARQITTLLDDDRARARLAEAGRQWVLSRRTWAENAELYRQVYATVRTSQ
jgi:glycosyltransferase involved in cell wall biosynthesis